MIFYVNLCLYFKLFQSKFLIKKWFPRQNFKFSWKLSSSLIWLWGKFLFLSFSRKLQFYLENTWRTSFKLFGFKQNQIFYFEAILSLRAPKITMLELIKGEVGYLNRLLNELKFLWNSKWHYWLDENSNQRVHIKQMLRLTFFN